MCRCLQAFNSLICTTVVGAHVGAQNREDSLVHRGCGPGKLHDLRSATVNNTRLACCAALHGLPPFLRHFSGPLMHDMAAFTAAFNAKITAGTQQDSPAGLTVALVSILYGRYLPALHGDLTLRLPASVLGR